MSGNFVAHTDFNARMQPTVEILNGLCAAIETASERNGHIPASGSWAEEEIKGEDRLRDATDGAWAEPVRSSHSIGGLTLTAATDHVRCYGQLFSGTRVPVFGQSVVARAALEASVVTFWLSDSHIDAEERARRGLCEELDSTWEVWKLKLPKGREEVNATLRRLQEIPRSLEWPITDLWGKPWTRKSRGRPLINGVTRPGTAGGIADLVIGTEATGLGKVLWGTLSATIHATTYSLLQSIVEPPSRSGSGPTVAKVGTSLRTVQLQSACVLRALRIAGEARLKLMGWADDVWNRAAVTADYHERALIFGVSPST